MFWLQVKAPCSETPNVQLVHIESRIRSRELLLGIQRQASSHPSRAELAGQKAGAANHLHRVTCAPVSATLQCALPLPCVAPLSAVILPCSASRSRRSASILRTKEERAEETEQKADAGHHKQPGNLAAVSPACHGTPAYLP